MLEIKHLMVIGVSKFMQHHHRHAAHFFLEDVDVSEFDASEQFWVSPVVTQPLCTRVVFSGRPNAFIGWREPKGDVSQLRKGFVRENPRRSFRAAIPAV